MRRTRISRNQYEYKLAKKNALQGRGLWMKFAGLMESGDPRSSQSIDQIVYGERDRVPRRHIPADPSRRGQS